MYTCIHISIYTYICRLKKENEELQEDLEEGKEENNAEKRRETEREKEKPGLCFSALGLLVIEVSDTFLENLILRCSVDCSARRSSQLKMTLFENVMLGIKVLDTFLENVILRSSQRKMISCGAALADLDTQHNSLRKAQQPTQNDIPRECHLGYQGPRYFPRECCSVLQCDVVCCSGILGWLLRLKA